MKVIAFEDVVAFEWVTVVDVSEEQTLVLEIAGASL